MSNKARFCVGMHTRTAITPMRRAPGAPLTEQRACRFAGRITQGLMMAEARRPSVRECAALHGVSPYTVVMACDQLLARGLLEARHLLGVFCVSRCGLPRPSPAGSRHPTLSMPPR